ncbi:MAG: hypothetical protein H6Q65_214 [Firmicutes bacterium]|nr:hypothetical protein [Bacillota bacterium]
MKILDWLLKYGSIVSLLVTVGAVIIGGLWARYKFNKQHDFAKQLQTEKAELDKSVKRYEQEFAIPFETYKTKLQEVAEKQKHLNQRRLTDFSLFAVKKHERSIELYEKLCNARNKVLWRNNPLRQLPAFTDYNKEDMREFLDKYNITRAHKEEMLLLWETNFKDAVDKIYKVMTSQEDLDASKAISEAVKAHLQADLYLPRDVSSEVDQFTSQLNQLAFLCSRENRQYISGEEHQKMYEERKEIAAKIEKEFPLIVAHMQKMLLSDSDEPETLKSFQ